MPWNETSAMDQRMHFIADYLEDYFPFSDLCRRYGISTSHRLQVGAAVCRRRRGRLDGAVG